MNGWRRWAVRLTVVSLAVGLASGIVTVIVGMRDHYTEVRQMHVELKRMQDSLNARR